MDINTACTTIDDIRGGLSLDEDRDELTALVRDLWDASTGRCTFQADEWDDVVLGDYDAQMKVRAVLASLKG